MLLTLRVNRVLRRVCTVLTIVSCWNRKVQMIRRNSTRASQSGNIHLPKQTAITSDIGITHEAKAFVFNRVAVARIETTWYLKLPLVGNLACVFKIKIAS